MGAKRADCTNRSYRIWRRRGCARTVSSTIPCFHCHCGQPCCCCMTSTDWQSEHQMQREDNHRQDRPRALPPPLPPQKHPKAAWCAVVNAPRRKPRAAQSLEDGEGHPPVEAAAAAVAEKSARKTSSWLLAHIRRPCSTAACGEPLDAGCQSRPPFHSREGDAPHARERRVCRHRSLLAPPPS